MCNRVQKVENLMRECSLCYIKYAKLAIFPFFVGISLEKQGKTVFGQNFFADVLQIPIFALSLQSHFGRLAQLVQSVCLTSRGSAVRIRQRPQKRDCRVGSLFFFLCNGYSDKLNMIGSVNHTFTGWPFCLPGMNFGSVLQTRTASSSRLRSTPRRTVTLPTEPSFVTTN